MRPRQWLKNLVCLAPVFVAGRIDEPAFLAGAGLATLSLCLVAGASYVINDLCDAASDAVHPLNASRPVASGRLPPGAALVYSGVALSSGLLLAGSAGLNVLAFVCAYFCLSLSYSLWLKHRAVVDVLAIAAGFALRAAAGAQAAGLAAGAWLVAVTLSCALFWALEKRLFEVSLLGADAGRHRQSLKFYCRPFMGWLRLSVVFAMVAAYALFVHFQEPWLVVTLPAVLFAMGRYELATAAGSRRAHPAAAFRHDRLLQATLILWLLLASLAIYGCR